MKCKSCGMKKKFTDKYCGYCGEKQGTEKNAYIHQRSLLLVGLFVLFFLILFIGYKVNEHFNRPSYIATKYFEAVIENDTEEIYSYLSKYEDSPFVSKEILDDKIEHLENVEHYSIKEIKEKDDRTYVEFQFDLDGVYTTSYVELKKKTFLHFFETYEVVSGKLAENVTLRVLKNAKITVDDKDIKDFLKKNDDDPYYDTYVIPYMIAGNYDFDVVLENGLTMKKDIPLSSSNIYTLSKIDLEQEMIQEMENTIKNTLNILYQGALNDERYEDISSPFKKDLSKLYESIKRTLKSNQQRIKSINFTDVQITKTMFNEKGMLDSEIFADYRMIYMTQENGKEIEQETNKYMSLAVVFDEQDHEFVIDDIYTSYNVKEAFTIKG